MGGGIAGIEAASKIANGGHQVYLVGRELSIGGHMIQLDTTFPTLDCSECIMTPKMTDVGHHPDIELLTYSEVEEVSGSVGNFKVKVRKKQGMWMRANVLAVASARRNVLGRHQVSLRQAWQ